jgi:hypothetical protein
LGHHTEAIACYGQALRHYRNLDNLYNQAVIEAQLGYTYQAAGDPDAARGAWVRGLQILGELDHPDADHLRVKLEQLSHPPSEPDAPTVNANSAVTDPVRDRLLILAPPGTEDRRMPRPASQPRPSGLFGGYADSSRERFHG